MDKKISELSIATVIDPADVSILVTGNTDKQFSFNTLLSFISTNITAGSNISFGTILPQNTAGKNGDVFVNTGTGAFAQKLSGVWTIVYNVPNEFTGDGTILYGLGNPASSTGKNGDTYINTGTGTFFKKALGSWVTVFSMLNGPPGVKGDKGDKGDTGANGKTILSGTSNPSNLGTGTDGDFYLNMNTMVLFGPKASGIWGTGIALKAHERLIVSSTDYRVQYDEETLSITLTWDDELKNVFSGIDAPTIRFQNKLADNSYQDRPDLYPVFNDNGANILTTTFEGVTPDLSEFKLIITR